MSLNRFATVIAPIRGGHNDFSQSFEALRGIGFDGYLAMECAVRGDAKTVLPEVVRYLRSSMG